MKRFFKGLIEWKISACVLFTAAIFIYLFFSLIYGNEQVATATLWGMFWACAAGSLIQAICFSDWVIKKMRYAYRSLLFVLLFLPVLTFAAWKTYWIPADHPGAWALFVAIFVVIFVVMTIGFEIYFQITGRRYDGLIGQYRKSKEKEE